MSAAARLLDALASPSLPWVEVFTKEGRSRSTRRELGVSTSQVREERGWAIRAGNQDRSLFVCGSGPLPTPRELEKRWPPMGGGGLELPRPMEARSRAVAGIESPLLGEGESLAQLAAVEARLAEEAPGARLIQAELDDGYAEVAIENSRGVRGSYRSRVASIRLWARGREHEARVETANRQARAINMPALARRLADRLSLATATGTPERARGAVLLAPEAAVGLFASLGPLFVGAGAEPQMSRLLGSREQPCSAAVTMIDDGGLEGGWFESAIDGEGVPTRRVVLVDRGEPLQPLLPWWQAEHGISSGCCFRPSWRQPPGLGPTHLFLQPAPRQSAAELLASIDRGYYFVDALSPAAVDLDADRFAIVMCGFDVERGRSRRSIRAARLSGAVSSLFATVEAVGKDLRFVMGRGGWGSPSLLITGLTIEP